MKKIVWFAAAFAIMLAIIGYSIYTINHIESVNEERREKEDAKNFIATIVVAPATTSIWDVLRATDAPVTTYETDAGGNQIIPLMPGETQPAEEAVNDEGTAGMPTDAPDAG